MRFLNRETKAEGEVRGRCVVVACACVQSVALLMMSKSRLYPNGLANSSGELGRNFIPHFTGGIQAFLTELIGKPAADPIAERGTSRLKERRRPRADVVRWEHW